MLDEAPVDVLRQGQIVRVELAFRIVPAGFASVLRMDMKSVTILNADIAMVSRFSDARNRQCADPLRIIGHRHDGGHFKAERDGRYTRDHREERSRRFSDDYTAADDYTASNNPQASVQNA